MSYFSLTDEQVKILAKKDANLLIEFQKEIHSQKALYYEKLRVFYWIISILLVVAFFFSIYAAQKDSFLQFTLQIIAASILLIAGGKIYYIDKPIIAKKAVIKSSKKKHFNAIEFEVVTPEDKLRNKKAFFLITAGCLIYIFSFTIIFIS